MNFSVFQPYQFMGARAAQTIHANVLFFTKKRKVLTLGRISETLIRGLSHLDFTLLNFVKSFAFAIK